MRSMLRLLSVISALILAAGSAFANPPPTKKGAFTSPEQILRFINAYRAKPEPAKMPIAMRAASELGVFHEMDSAGIYVGFMAGVLQVNPARA